ncbi:tetraacyldisaccharide 4'-kinase [Aliidiomarina iranensis]|uniref:Tetraacyldisaccharide 4'-kinase n=1 Tax=Aliidiomarina iranensis TaxID=1434071 RepID=A0A432W0M8_9GAMM|nr:tetraacyldisaccharide 4'-kinase [Aliidiomarina iranensis]RUO22575.1 tetraacyldisaccharide 4'-kinase [Aliidiomarina iranensis]
MSSKAKSEQSKFEKALVRYWYQTRLALPLWLLIPFSVLFRVLAALRRLMYWLKLKRTWQPPVPMIIVGNVTVGGTGKTPTVLGLVAMLQRAGYRPGIISRGYGGVGPFPMLVTGQSNPVACGDEPVMLASLSGVPVAVAPKRPEAAQLLLNEHQCDVLIADDGLQHYALGRDIELAVVDGERGLGNGWRLPAGPLRESARRLRKVDWVIVNGAKADEAVTYGKRLKLSAEKSRQHIIPMQLEPNGWFRVSDNKEIEAPTGENVLAIAGIGNPERFFNLIMLHQINIQETRVFPDHYQYQPQDFYNIDNETLVLMTEKDAIKCASFARPYWYYLQVAARFSADFEAEFLHRVKTISLAKTKR